MVKADKLVERLGARVELNAGWVVVDNEAVVGRWGHSAEGELFIGVEFGVRLNGTGRDVFVIDDLVQVARESHTGALDRGTARNVEVAYHESLAKLLVSYEISHSHTCGW